MLDSGMPVDVLAGGPIDKWTPLTVVGAVPKVDRQALAACVTFLLDRGANIDQESSITSHVDKPTTALTNVVLCCDV